MNSFLCFSKKRFLILALTSLSYRPLLEASDAVATPGVRQNAPAQAAANSGQTFERGADHDSDSQGALRGSIETSEGHRIYGAQIRVDTATTTSVDGSYLISGLPPGKHVITVSADGFITATAEITLFSQQTWIQKIVLENEVPVQLERVTIQDQVTANSIAFDDKALKDGVTEMVQGSALTRQGAQNATDALKGVTGVAVSRASDGSSNIAIRGLAPQLNRVTVDGQRQSNQSRFGGSNALDSLPPEILKAIEVNKVVTPDMDADTIGGTISVSTADASALKSRFLQTKEQVIYGTIGQRAGSRSSVTIGKPFSLGSAKPNSGALFSLSYDQTYRSSQSLETTDNWPELISPGPEPYVGTPVPAFTKVDLQQALERRQRYSVLFNIDTRLGPTLLYLKLNFTRDHSNRAQAQMLFDVAEGTPVSLTPSRGTFSDVPISLQGSKRVTVRDMTTASLGQKTDFGRVHFTSSAGFSETRETLPNTVYSNFKSKDPFTVSYNFVGSPDSPTFDFSDTASLTDKNSAVLKPAEYQFNQLFILNNSAKDGVFSGQADVKIDLGKIRENLILNSDSRAAGSTEMWSNGEMSIMRALHFLRFLPKVCCALRSRSMWIRITSSDRSPTRCWSRIC